MLKRILLGLVITSILAGIAFVAVGGRVGLSLLMVSTFLRKDYAASHDINWKQGPTEKSTNRAPNIIVIVADDLGFNDITLNGGGIADGSVPTPNINAIAREGVQFQSGYAGNATCAPSRAAIMTGRYPTRYGFEFTPVPVQFMRLLGQNKKPGALHDPVYYPEREKGMIAYEDQGLPTTEVTIAKLLQGAGYHTAHVGKWHLGDSPQFRSYSHGFDESLSLMHGASMFLPEKDPGVVNAKQDFDLIDRFIWAADAWGIRFNDGEPFKPPRYLTDYLTDEAIKVVEKNKNQPFFLYLAYNAPHTPLQATKADYDALSHIPDHTTRVYAAMIRSLDRNIGRVLQSLKDQGVDDNTLIVFTSDNGGAHYIGIEGINKPYRGWKATFFDGGTHVPFFMRWPAKIARGSSYPQMVSHFDIFSTAAAAAGVAQPSDRIIDGANLLPYIRGEAKGHPHDRLFWRSGDYRVVRDGDWKLQITELPKQDWLYNVASDPGEKNNLASQQPAKVAELRAMIIEFNKQQAKPLWPSLAEGAIALDKSLRQPQAAEDAYIYFAN
jgi:arylsulfatase A-like enzyme